jgi:hypothetical protein
MLDIFFIITAVVGITVLTCQFVLTLMGLSDHGDAAMGDVGDSHSGDGFDGDVSGHDSGVPGDHHTAAGTAADGQLHPDSTWLFGVVTFRTIVSASAFFGLAGMAALRSGFSPSSSLILAAAAGLAAMYVTYWSMRAIAGLASSGNERIDNAVGCFATVYIPIPADQKGAGKVQLSMQNRIVEFLAVTDDVDRLPTGLKVEVVGVVGNDTVTVRRVVEPVHA